MNLYRDLNLLTGSPRNLRDLSHLYLTTIFVVNVSGRPSIPRQLAVGKSHCVLLEFQDFDLSVYLFQGVNLFRLHCIFDTFRIVKPRLPLQAGMLARVVALISTMDEGCCGSKLSKELLHVPSVGADKDLFNIITLGVP